MKKYLNLFILSIFVFSLTTSIALANNSLKLDTLNLFKQEREKIQNERQNMLQERQEAKEEFKNTLALSKEEVIKNRAELKQKMENLKLDFKKEKDASKAKILENRILGREQALSRFENAIERMSSLKEKVSLVIQKHEANGLNVSEAKNLVAQAEEKINSAQIKTNEAYALLSNSTNQLSEEEKIKLQSLTKETQELLREAHLLLNKAIQNIRETIIAKIEDVKNNLQIKTTEEIETETIN